MSCCPNIWYCTPAGPVAVSPDGAGLYTPPAGWTGGPFADYDDAVASADGCGCAPDPLVTTCGGFAVSFPTLVFVTIADLTGDFVGLWADNSVAVPLTPVGPANLDGAVLIRDVNGQYWGVIVRIGCNDLVGLCGANQVVLQVSLYPVGTSSLDATLAYYGCSGSYVTGSAAAGWNYISGSTYGAACRDPETETSPLIAAGGEEVGTFTYSCTTMTGSYTLYVST